MAVIINGVGITTLLNGDTVKHVLSAANEIMAKGIYNATTLSAVDADLAPANIKDSITIFGFLGTVTPGSFFTDYHYYEDLAQVASYTPPVQALALLCNEATVLASDVLVQFHDGGGWVDAHSSAFAILEATCNIFQDTDQNLRVHNASHDNPQAYKISLTGIIWTGSTYYHHYEDLAIGATYTPPAKSIATLFNESTYLISFALHIEFYDGGGWVDAYPAPPSWKEASRLLLQDNSQNIRVINDATSPGDIKISLTGITWT